MEIKMGYAEKIMEFIRDCNYIPLKKDDLFFMLSEENDSDFAAFETALAQLCAEAKITFTKRGKIISAEQAGLMQGVFMASSKGFGFVRPNDSSAKAASIKGDVYIAFKNSLGAIHGDTVAFTVIGETDGLRLEGRITHIVEHALTHVIGTLIERRGQRGVRARYAVQPDQKKLTFLVYIDNAHAMGARLGDKVEACIQEYPDEVHDGVGHITKVFGPAFTVDANYEAVLHEYGIQTKFNRHALAQADLLATAPVSAACRMDLRDKLIFTIDGEDAKDLDDAISIERTKDGYLLGVHIADVSHYVTENSYLDKEAFGRGTSVYFADQVVPMLPKALSNGICSLHAGEDKYALSVIMTLDKDGGIQKTELAETIIRPKIRGVYAEMNDLMHNGKGAACYEKYASLFPDTLSVMMELSDVLHERARQRGAVELSSAEAKFIMDENGHPVKILKRKVGKAEKCIEYFMLCANEAVALWLNKQDLPCVYRIHEDPTAEKMQALRLFASHIGLDTTPLRGKKVTPKDVQLMLGQAEAAGVLTAFSSVALRAMMKARYSERCSMHFGLALETYCHFTSPIRRYPDLVVHRIIKKVLHGGFDQFGLSGMQRFVTRAAAAASESEKRVLTAERAIEDLYKCVYMQERIGQVYRGQVSLLTNFGLFVVLENTCEGLIPIGSLDGYYVYNENNMTLCGHDRQYALADSVMVRIEDVNLSTRRIYMSLVEEQGNDESKIL
ncbi:MAG: ribonuclease R [Clostridiales bacterium]|nr:ribonuclease R [Clostridiales bacterium]